MKTIVFILLYLIFMLNYCIGQNRFSKIDAYALKAPVTISNNLDSLSIYLTKPYSEEIDKVRSIYIWVSNNIAYDYEKLKENHEEIIKSIDPSQQANYILSSKMAVCEGYSNLFYELCKKTNITCEVITGFSKQDNDVSNTGHGWNAVKIKNDWKLLDATWSAGYIDRKDKKFIKQFNDKYFLKDAKDFLTDHYPADVMWQLVQHPISKAEFKSGKTVGDATTIFDYNDTITNYFKLDSSSKRINSYLRILHYDATNKLAALNLMIERMNQAIYQLNEGINMYNQCIKIVNEARISKRPKILNTRQVFLTDLTNLSKNKIATAQHTLLNIRFTDRFNSKLLEKNNSTTEDNLSLIKTQIEYLEKYYATWKPLRIFVL